jgi:hypothetical protein
MSYVQIKAFLIIRKESIERINKTINRNKEADMPSLYVQQWLDIKNEAVVIVHQTASFFKNPLFHGK